jgi:hypothetical protein
MRGGVLIESTQEDNESVRAEESSDLTIVSSFRRACGLVAGTEEYASQSPTRSLEKEMTVRKLLNSVTDTLCIDLLSAEPPSSLRA